MFKKLIIVGCLTLFLLVSLLTGNALAETPAAVSELNTGDTAFMLISSALVMLMTPGLAFFYGGFVRSHNILNTLMMSFVLMAIVGVTWVLWGYSLSFAPGLPFIGGLQWLGLNGVGLETTGYLKGSAPADVVSYAGTIPHQAFMIYQAMFAIITPALISGAIAERMSFRAYCLFVVLWSTFIYTPLAHMVWAKGGFLGLYGGIGALDFAGGTVVHISSGVSALVAAMVLGPRKNYPNRLSPPHNVPFILLGAGLLWFGWFGFNAGSALSAGTVATVAFVTTNTSAAAGALMWLILEATLRGKPTAVGAATGAVAGLVGITPAAGFVTPVAAILIGFITSVVCFFAVSYKHKLQIDDALDTYPVHGVGGTIGAILTAIFATTEVNSGGKDGVLRGNFGELFVELGAIALAYIIAAVGTWIILKIIAATVGLRVPDQTEDQGLDINEHGEEGYNSEFADRISNK
ncbi:ammonium transporter [Dolichospermum sp. ST_sed3]|nr:ammonium transporter [Dolichospermum sp. ST_sed9]MDD1432369.1 ammonium transporter [Dolichospermum sp. ST_sed6]MDD1436732.1 ammonium transporter [Dolichospermum sp. ST_sed10]MDD1442855.1 ammonium transporter [Dolichospermum sp. ST_sed3]MDD1446850.1 ammonium transporter [Dolichospermum sp. ST_sed8]MDD1457095.1 ammonium transporter [Dolichospermum sp. ST_sed7]MDD1459128.1 ammonium transporter [Dolichospermum sp. ST_sed2]MDD1468881.1 ammonium transporter [Dolichospermum sp. ST_sed5]MDD14705